MMGSTGTIGWKASNVQGIMWASTEGGWTAVSSDAPMSFGVTASTSAYTYSDYSAPKEKAYLERVCENCGVEAMIPTSIKEITALTCPQCGGALRDIIIEEDEPYVPEPFTYYREPKKLRWWERLIGGKDIADD